MAITAEEARQLLSQNTQTAKPAISPEEAKSLLASGGENIPPRAAQDGNALSLLKDAAAISAGGLKEFGRLTQSIPGSGFGLGALAKFAASRPQAKQVLEQSPTLGQAGGGLADIAAFAGTSELATPMLGGLGGAGSLGKIIRGAIKGFPAGMVVSPEDRLTGGALGSIAEPAAIGAGKALKALPKMDVVLRSRLGQRVISSFNKVKDESKELYSKAFEGTEGVIPQLSKNTVSNISELSDVFPGKRNPVQKALKKYDKSKSIENLHFLRSDLGKEWNKLEIKKNSPVGLTTSEKEEQELLDESRRNISKSLENNFNNFSPEKKALYDNAQSHFENNVAPFSEKGHTAIMKALSSKRDITNKLFNEIAADSIPAQKVRNVVGLSRPQLEIAKLLRSKLITIPALGAGIFLGGKKFL